MKCPKCKEGDMVFMAHDRLYWCDADSDCEHKMTEKQYSSELMSENFRRQTSNIGRSAPGM